MAITRSQIARQLLAAGGVSFESPGNTTLQRVLPRMDGQRPGFYGSDAGFGDDDYKDESASFDAGSGSGSDNNQPGTTGATFPNLDKVTPRDVFKTSADNPMLQRSLFERAMIQMIPGIGGAINLGEMNAFNLPQFRYSNTGGIDNRFNTTDDDDNNQIVRPMMPMVPKLPTDIEPEKSDYTEFVQRFSLPEQYRLADGGEVRQAYGLGSIVKKVTGAVKKVVKSPIGKAALAVGLSGVPFGAGSAGTGFFGSKSLFGRALPFAQNVLFGKATQSDAMMPFIRDGGLKKFLGTTAGRATAGILGTSLAAGLLTPKQEEEAESLTSRIADNTGIDVAAIRKEVQEAYANNTVGSLKNKYPFLITQSAAAAEGGRIGLSEGTSMEQKEFEEFLDTMKQRDMGAMRDQILKDFEKYKQRKKMIDKMPEVKDGGRIGYDMGGISGLMASNMENDKILENLFEKYLDMGLSPEDAAKKAREEFDRMSKAEEPDRMMAAIGGMMNPNDEMLNLGGNEMDLRGGGFVPLGEYEKKDDVPARLSKNEFVFTADAVKAAGGGSVDRGADLMYKTMKQLENKVA